MMDEFKAVKKIMDAIEKNWELLAPDTKVWLKSRLTELPAPQLPRRDVDEERV